MNEDIEQRLHDLSAVYGYDDRTAVEEFLMVHPDILPYVEQSPAEIEKHFPDADLTLTVEMDEDEENPGGSAEKLFILISVEGAVGDAQSRLERLDESWSIDVCEATSDLLVIDLQYGSD